MRRSPMNVPFVEPRSVSHASSSITSINACCREHCVSERTTSALTRPMVTFGFSISKMRPESGPAMHASESRYQSGSFSGRSLDPPTGGNSPVDWFAGEGGRTPGEGSGGGVGVGRRPRIVESISSTAPGPDRVGTGLRRGSEAISVGSSVKSSESMRGARPGASSRGVAGFRISKISEHFVHRIFFTRADPKRSSS